jgi:hypothetical protein
LPLLLRLQSVLSPSPLSLNLVAVTSTPIYKPCRKQSM